MADFKNEFSWSKSRDSTFNECKRKYYYNHYGFWNGWNSFSDEKTKRIYYLKKINTKEIWIGQLIHGTIEYILKQYKIGNKISLAHAIAILRKKLDVEYTESKIKTYTGYSSKLNKLFEHEYNLEITEDDRKKLFDKAELALINFYNSDLFMEIRKIPIDNWILLEDFLKFDFNGTTIFLSIDFAIKSGEKIIIYDWKTGQERKDDFDLQMACYSLYVYEKFGISPENIIAKAFYLSIDKVDEFYVDFEKLEKTKKYIEKSIEEMSSFLLDKIENVTTEENFPKEKGFYCSRCNFKKICEEN